MKDNIVLEVSQLKKRFKIYSNPFNILKEWATLGARSYHRDFWALKGISFEIAKGEFVGIIGPNGAGKSTLLRIITNVLRPTDGSYKVNGRVLSILELTGGTDKDLTGRENVIRTGQLMGFPDGYVQERMERIKEFSELGDFFEQPLRTYSTGMKTRLSFSMFAFMDTDILILDEVLAVGDIFFQVKCFARLAELIEKNTSIILVTHSLEVVQRYCKRAILLAHGEKLYDGDTAEAVRLFMDLHGAQKAKSIQTTMLHSASIAPLAPTLGESSITSTMEGWPEPAAFIFRSFPHLRGRGRVDVTRMAILDDKGTPTTIFKQGGRMHLYLEFRLKKDISKPVINIEIKDSYNLLVHSKNSYQNNANAPSPLSQGSVVHYHQSIVLDLAPKNYVIDLDCFDLTDEIQTELERPDFGGLARRMTRLFRLNQVAAVSISPRVDAILVPPHGGLCNLAGESHFAVSA